MQRFKILGATMLVCLAALVAAVTAGADEQDTAPVRNGAAAEHTVPVQDSDAPSDEDARPRGDDCPERDGGGSGPGGSGGDDGSSSQGTTPTPTPDL